MISLLFYQYLSNEVRLDRELYLGCLSYPQPPKPNLLMHQKTPPLVLWSLPEEYLFQVGTAMYIKHSNISTLSTDRVFSWTRCQRQEKSNRTLSHGFMDNFSISKTFSQGVKKQDASHNVSRTRCQRQEKVTRLSHTVSRIRCQVLRDLHNV